MVLINMKDCNKRYFFARLQFRGKERLRETKRGEASRRKHGLSSLLIVNRAVCMVH